MTANSYLDDQMIFYIKRLKALRRNEDKTLKFDFHFEAATRGLFSIRSKQDDEPYFGSFQVIADSACGGIRIDMHCRGFYISRAKKVERANQYQYSDHKVILDKFLTPIASLHQREPIKKRRTVTRVNN